MLLKLRSLRDCEAEVNLASVNQNPASQVTAPPHGQAGSLPTLAAVLGQISRAWATGADGGFSSQFGGRAAIPQPPLRGVEAMPV